MWIILMVFVTAQGPQPFIWSDDHVHYAIYKSEAACERRVKQIEVKIDAMGGAPPMMIGCKKVEEPAKGDTLDSDHT